MRSSFDAAVGPTTTVDFEAQNPHGPYGYVYYGGILTIGDVTFTQPDQRMFVFGQSFNPTNGLTSSYLNQFCCAPTGLTATFANPVRAIGMDLGIQNYWNANSNDITVTLSTGDLINTTGPLLYTGASMVFFGLTSNEGITSIHFDDPSQGLAVDNLSFSETAQSAVPEPTSLLLLGTGLFAGVRRWRKRETTNA